jgi:hypothetical protein
MKKINILLSIFLISNICVAQDTIQKKYRWNSNNIIKVNLPLLVKHLTVVSYERVLTKKFTIATTYGQGKYSITGQAAEANLANKQRRSFPCVQEIKLNSYFSLEPRYYISFDRYKIPAGIHIGPSVNFHKSTETYTSTNEFHYNSVNYGRETVTTGSTNRSILINLGTQILIKRIIALDLCAGLGYGRTFTREKDTYSNAPQSGSSADFSFGAIATTFTASLGIAFGK